MRIPTDTLQRALQSFVLRANRGQSAIMGDKDGTVRVSGQSNEVYIQIQEGARRRVVRARNGGDGYPGVPEIAGKEVRYIQTDSGKYLVIGMDANRTVETDTGHPIGNIGPHGHGFKSGMLDMIESLRFLPGLVHINTAGADMNVEVQPFLWQWEGTRGRFAGGTLDLTSNKPSSGEHRWVLVYFDPSGEVLAAANGTATDILTALDEDDIPDISATGIWLGAYQLRGDDSSVNDPDRFAEGRFLVANEAGAAISPLTTKGDLWGYSTVDARIPIGSNDQVLTADSGEALGLKWATPSTGSATVDIEVTAGENLSERDYVYLNDADNEWYQVDIDATPPEVSRDRGIVVESGGISEDGTGTVRIAGEATGFSGLSAGSQVYAHTTAGGYTQTKPTVTDGGAQKAVVIIGVATATTKVLVVPSNPIEYLKRSTLANNGTLTLQHHDDPSGRTRSVKAFLNTTPAGSTIESYGSGNQDDDVELQYSIREDLISWWDLDEASGTRDDSHGSNDLTDNNTVTQAAGVVSNAAQFTNANDEYLSHASNSDLQLGDSTYFWEGWVYLDNKTTSQAFVGKDTSGSGTREYSVLYVQPYDRFVFLVYKPTDDQVEVRANSFGAPSTSTWYLVRAWHDADADTIYIQIDNGTVDSQATGGALQSTNTDLLLGRQGYPGYTYPLDGRLDEWKLWKGRIPTSDERTWLYNSGSGRSYADTAPNTQLAQSFQIDSENDIASVDLYLRKVGSPTGNLTVEIQTDSGGSPSGTPVTNGTSDAVAASTLGASYGSESFSFSTAPTLSGSTTYWLVLKTTDSGDAQDYVQWGSDSSAPGYADGEMKSYDGSSWTALSMDAIFAIANVGTAYDEPVLVGSWSVAGGEFSARFDDGSGSDGDTKTTFKNITGSSVDATCIVELP